MTWEHTRFTDILGPTHATEVSATGSANRDNWELPVLVSALRGRVNTTGAWFVANVPDADDGREFGPQALEACSWDLSLPAVDGRVTLPLDEGRPVRGLDEPTLVSVAGGDNAEGPQAFCAEEDERLPQLSVPLHEHNMLRHQLNSLKLPYNLEATKLLKVSFKKKKMTMKKASN